MFMYTIKIVKLEFCLHLGTYSAHYIVLQFVNSFQHLYTFMLS